MSISWRELERHLIDAFRREGLIVENVCGEPHIIDERFDDNTGQLIDKRPTASVERLAHMLADAINTGHRAAVQKSVRDLTHRVLSPTN
jgi:hypothetical protein